MNRITSYIYGVCPSTKILINNNNKIIYDYIGNYENQYIKVFDGQYFERTKIYKSKSKSEYIYNIIFKDILNDRCCQLRINNNNYKIGILDNNYKIGKLDSNYKIGILDNIKTIEIDICVKDLQINNILLNQPNIKVINIYKYNTNIDLYYMNNMNLYYNGINIKNNWQYDYKESLNIIDTIKPEALYLNKIV